MLLSFCTKVQNNNEKEDKWEGDIYADNKNTNTLRFSRFLLERRGQKKHPLRWKGCFYR